MNRALLLTGMLAVGCNSDSAIHAFGQGSPMIDQTNAVDIAEPGAEAAESFWEAHGELLGGSSLSAIPAGEFTMGLDARDEDFDANHTPHHVTLTHDFWIGTTEVTVTQWMAYMGYQPAALHNDAFQAQVELEQCADCPVNLVSWDEILAFANAVSRAHGLEECFACDGDGADVQCDIPADPYACEGYRIPTEAEWEHAARGGEGFRYPGSDDVDEIGYWEDNSDSRPHSVASKRPNGFGIYDMGGNIREFVLDWYIRYGDEEVVNPLVYPEDGAYPAERGGSWQCRVPELRPERRNLKWDYVRDVHSGFRLARTVHPDELAQR
jgi:formylglycine-generating enzyme required for sulfatase activity